jgi:hypothetical protein
LADVHYWKRNNLWFKRRCQIGLEQFLDRIEGTIVKKGVDDLELPAPMFIARHRIPAYQQKPKELTHRHDLPVGTSVSTTVTRVDHFTDEELETLNRLLMKAGVPEHLLQPPPIDVEAEAQPLLGDGKPGPK